MAAWIGLDWGLITAGSPHTIRFNHPPLGVCCWCLIITAIKKLAWGSVLGLFLFNWVSAVVQSLQHKINSKYTDKKKQNQVLLIYKEIQVGLVAKSYVSKGLFIYG